MNPLSKNISLKNPAIDLFVMVLVFIAVYLIASFAAMVAVLPLYGFSVERVQGMLATIGQSPNDWAGLMILQAVIATGAFILSPIIYITQIKKMQLSVLFAPAGNDQKRIGVAAFFVIAALPLINAMIVYNQGIQLPAFLADFESYSIAKEEQLEKLTLFLTDFDSFGKFLIGIAVIAVIPAIGEELLFRGLLQSGLHAAFKNGHAAVWVSAFIFSFFHMQFFGLIPRMALGIFFGYFFLWSGNLKYSMLAHFVNNAFTLSLLYYMKTNNIPTEEALNPGYPHWALLAGSLLVSGMMMYVFFRGGEPKQPEDEKAVLDVYPINPSKE